jgi:mannose-6-phosphate isomerase-like protein (cupin superfamily)
LAIDVTISARNADVSALSQHPRAIKPQSRKQPLALHSPVRRRIARSAASARSVLEYPSQTDAVESMPVTDKINLAEKFSLFSEHWRPKTVAALNGQEVKLIKVRGEFPWHVHEQEDEFFLVWKGRFRVEFRDRIVTLERGECVTVPRGTLHRTCADDEAEILCFEPAGVRNTGNVTDEIFTAPKNVAI